MSSTSLYSNVGNVTVSANNLTTLYNATGGNVTTGNVPDTNFTTLYSTLSSQLEPTKPYGNANVEAFLNVGSDAGGNVVQNINMSGTLTVGGQTNLGPVSNVHITGGQYNYVLTTDGAGNLSWNAQNGGGGNAVPYIHFDVTTNGNNQVFTSAELENYQYANAFNLFKNGVNIEPFYYTKTSNTSVQVNIPLLAGDTIDILASGGGGGGAAGNSYDVQFNGGGILAGSNSFTYNPTTDTVTANNLVANVFTVTTFNIGNTTVDNFTANSIIAGNITANGNVVLGNVGNVHINGGSNGQYLGTDGNGNLSWSFVNNVANANYANSSNTANTANIANIAYSVSGSNVTGYVGNAIHANIADAANIAYSVNGANVSGYVSDANHANFADVANSVAVANVVGIGNIATINITGSSSNVLYGNGVFAGLPNTIATANFANYAGNVTVSSQPNITSVGNLDYLRISNTSNNDNTITTFTANLMPVVSAGTNSFSSSMQQIFADNFQNIPSTYTIRARGNSTSPTTAVNGDFVFRHRSMVYNGSTNVFVAGTRTSASGPINANANASTTGGLFQIVTGNPAAANANTITLGAVQHSYTFTNSGSLTIQRGTAPNLSAGSTNQGIMSLNTYGSNSANLTQSLGIVYNRYRGDIDGNLSVQANDVVASTLYTAYNGANLNSKTAEIVGYVDSSYVANTANVPLNIRIGPSDGTNNQYTYFYANGLVQFTNSISVTGTSTLGNVGNVKITGGSNSQILTTDGTGNLSWTNFIAPTANFANFAGNVTISSQPNITSLGSLTSLVVSGPATVQEVKEIFTPNNTGATGTINFDVLTSAIILQTANASANFTLNIRGNGTTTFNSFANTNESTSITYVNKNGATGYVLTGITIDGTSVIPVWPEGLSPISGTANGYDVYNFNILKTGSATYAVFAMKGSYL